MGDNYLEDLNITDTNLNTETIDVGDNQAEYVTYPHNIVAPNLIESNYGENIKKQFSNIDKNFKVLGNHDFIKGQQGNSIYIKNIGLVKEDIATNGITQNIDGVSKTFYITDETLKREAYIGYKIYIALKNAIENWCGKIAESSTVSTSESGNTSGDDIIFNSGDTIYNTGDFNKALKSIGTEEYAIYNWDDIIRFTSDFKDGSITNIKYNYNIPVVVSQDRINNTETYICSAGLVLFTDNRFCASAIDKYQFISSSEGGYSEGIVDVTCFPNFTCDSNGNWTCELNLSYPRLKYKEVQNNNGEIVNRSLYWVIGDDDSLIKATGIKGEKGEKGKIWITRYENYLESNNGKIINIDSFLLNNKDGYSEFVSIENLSNYLDSKDKYPQNGDIIIVYEYTGVNYLGYFITDLIESNGNYQAYRINDNVTRIDYKANTKEFFKVLGQTEVQTSGSGQQQIETAKGMFLLFDPNGQYYMSSDGFGLTENTPAHIIYNSITQRSSKNQFDCTLNIAPVEKYDDLNSGIPESSSKYNPKLNINYNTNISSELNVKGGAVITGRDNGGTGVVVTGGTGVSGSVAGTGLVVWGGVPRSGGSTGLGIKVESGGINVNGGATISGGANITGGSFIVDTDSDNFSIKTSGYGISCDDLGSMNINTNDLTVEGGVSIDSLNVTGSAGINITGGATISGSVKLNNDVKVGGTLTVDRVLIVNDLIKGQSGLDINNYSYSGSIIKGRSGLDLRNETGGTSQGGYGLTIWGGTGGITPDGKNGYGGAGLVVYGGPTASMGTGGGVGNAIEAHGNISVTGRVNASIGFFQTSDERLKSFKDDVVVDLDKLSSIPKKYFTWKAGDTKSLNIGTSAQEIQKLYPELVSKDSEGNLSVAYDKLSIIALKAIDELQLKNKELEERINKLENIILK